MDTLFNVGKKCFVNRDRKAGEYPRLVICSACKSRNIVYVNDSTTHVRCMKCHNTKIRLSKKGE